MNATAPSYDLLSRPRYDWLMDRARRFFDRGYSAQMREVLVAVVPYREARLFLPRTGPRPASYAVVGRYRETRLFFLLPREPRSRVVLFETQAEAEETAWAECARYGFRFVGTIEGDTEQALATLAGMEASMP